MASRELAEEQNKIMAVAREVALSEMRAQLRARQLDIEEQVAGERRRCESVRNRHLQKTADCQQEVLRYKQCIEELNMGYRRKSQRGTSSRSTPRAVGNVAVERQHRLQERRHHLM